MMNSTNKGVPVFVEEIQAVKVWQLLYIDRLEKNPFSVGKHSLIPYTICLIALAKAQS